MRRKVPTFVEILRADAAMLAKQAKAARGVFMDRAAALAKLRLGPTVLLITSDAQEAEEITLGLSDLALVDVAIHGDAEKRLQKSFDLIIFSTKNVRGTVDGMEIASLVRKAKPLVPLIFLGPASSKPSARMYGAEAFFEKPIDIWLLLAKVRELLLAHEAVK